MMTLRHLDRLKRETVYTVGQDGARFPNRTFCFAIFFPRPTKKVDTGIPKNCLRRRHSTKNKRKKEKDGGDNSYNLLTSPYFYVIKTMYNQYLGQKNKLQYSHTQPTDNKQTVDRQRTCMKYLNLVVIYILNYNS